MKTIPSTFKFTYVRGPDNVPYGTIAYEYDEEKKQLWMAAAFCHPNDIFSKAQGRVKAAGQLVRFKTTNKPLPGVRSRYFMRANIERDQIGEELDEFYSTLELRGL